MSSWGYTKSTKNGPPLINLQWISRNHYHTIFDSSEHSILQYCNCISKKFWSFYLVELTICATWKLFSVICRCKTSAIPALSSFTYLYMRDFLFLFMEWCCRYMSCSFVVLLVAIWSLITIIKIKWMTLRNKRENDL